MLSCSYSSKTHTIKKYKHVRFFWTETVFLLVHTLGISISPFRALTDIVMANLHIAHKNHLQFSLGVTLQQDYKLRRCVHYFINAELEI